MELYKHSVALLGQVYNSLRWGSNLCTQLKWWTEQGACISFCWFPARLFVIIKEPVWKSVPITCLSMKTLLYCQACCHGTQPQVNLPVYSWKEITIRPLYMLMFVHGIYRNLCFSRRCIKSPRSVYSKHCKLADMYLPQNLLLFLLV